MSKLNTEDIIEVSVKTSSIGLVSSALFVVIVAWPVMLGLGAAHAQWPVVPAFGYWTTYIVTLAIHLVASLTRPRS